MLSTIKLAQNGKLSSLVGLISLTPDYTISSDGGTKWMESFHGRVEELRDKFEENGTVYHTKYELIGGKYSLKLFNITGEAIKQLRKHYKNDNLYDDAVEDNLRANQEQKQTISYLKNTWILNMSAFGLGPSSFSPEKGFSVGSQDLYRFTGSRWVNDKVGNLHISSSINKIPLTSHIP